MNASEAPPELAISLKAELDRIWRETPCRLYHRRVRWIKAPVAKFGGGWPLFTIGGEVYGYANGRKYDDRRKRK